MALKLITGPAAEAITLEEAKQHLRVVDTDEDSLISIYIRAARQWCEGPEGFLGRALVTQTWDLVLDSFPTAEIKVPLPPLQEVVYIKYDDTAGNEQSVSATNYYVDNVSEPGWVLPTADWPSTINAVNSVRVRFKAGYPEDTGVSPPDIAANVPFDIKAAMLLLIGSMYENREEVVAGVTLSQLPFGVQALLRPHRVNLGMA